MQNKEQYTIELQVRQYEYLREMVEKYALPDVGKAIRCLIDMSVESPDLESKTFQEIRCLDC